MKQQYHEVFITDSGETTVFRWRVEHPLRPGNLNGRVRSAEVTAQVRARHSWCCDAFGKENCTKT